ncbi:hypothetical protein [Streptomyces goshikiensis]|uniref:hypothetical protein n=1 Tax=Streptomyces goshikiensis TaxID=1942 RepID=UPI00364DB5FA
MAAEGAADRPEADPGRPEGVPPSATGVPWRELPEPHRVAHRYGVVAALLESGVGAARIRVFHDPESDGAYWAVVLDGGRTAVLTDDTEEHAGHLEGPWPFKAVLLGPEGVRTRIAPSIDALTAHVVGWYAETRGRG